VALSFLDYLLTGTSASPLRKAITDSGLGESIIGGGMDDTLRQPTYSMGLKGVAPDNVEKVCPPSLSCRLLSVHTWVPPPSAAATRTCL
jgi:Zn-dependent M16 (insulinase) family peptidase